MIGTHSENHPFPESSESERPPPEPVPFPCEALPPGVREFVESGAQSRGIPPDFIATPLLGFVGAMIGNQVSLRIKGGWVERAIMWTACVGGPGVGKTPGSDYARGPLDAIQEELWKEYTVALVGQPLKQGGTDAPPKPSSVYTTDATLEAVASILGSSSGLAVYHDEVAGWVNSFDKYSGGSGDRQKWLSMWSGGPLKTDRKTTAAIYVPHPAVSVVGGVQPERLPDLRGSTVNDGFPDRFLLSYPHAKPQGWLDEEDDPALVQGMRNIINQIHARWGQEEPLVTRLNDGALGLFKQFVNDNAEAIAESSGLVAGWAAKAPSHLARIALALHCLTEPEFPELPISEKTLESAVELVEYYRAHFIRCLPLMGAHGDGPQAGDATRILRALRKTGAWTARSELTQATRIPADRLSTALAELATRELVTHKIVSTTGRSREEWCVSSMVTTPPRSDSEDSEEGRYLSPSSQLGGKHCPFPESSESEQGSIGPLVGSPDAFAVCCVCGTALPAGSTYLCERCVEATPTAA